MSPGDSDPKHPVPAATVVLMRQSAGELQVYLLKRSLKSKFMAGNYVFPGGVVDADDRKFEVWKPRVDLDFDGISRRLGGNLSGAEALFYGVAAIRETLEEAGVVLARRKKPGKDDLERICTLRLSADLAKDWFRQLAVSEGWVLELSALSRWSHWITPERMKQRFDTRFFLASMPAEQSCRSDCRETTHGLWISPEKGLAGNLAGEIPLSPPTLVTLHQLLDSRSLKDLEKELQDRQWGEAFLPRLVPLDKGVVIIEPWDPLYHQKEIRINGRELTKAVLPLGASFSRIWFNGGIWKPVQIG
jgi:8-oxo-dGTP pyrophosphatase MutT (NUDIX family)